MADAAGGSEEFGSVEAVGRFGVAVGALALEDALAVGFGLFEVGDSGRRIHGAGDVDGEVEGADSGAGVEGGGFVEGSGFAGDKGLEADGAGLVGAQFPWPFGGFSVGTAAGGFDSEEGDGFAGEVGDLEADVGVGAAGADVVGLEQGVEGECLGRRLSEGGVGDQQE